MPLFSKQAWWGSLLANALHVYAVRDNKAGSMKHILYFVLGAQTVQTIYFKKQDLAGSSSLALKHPWLSWLWSLQEQQSLIRCPFVPGAQLAFSQAECCWPGLQGPGFLQIVAS